jgi:hypothetical protein
MTDLNWRAADVTLHEELAPDPNGGNVLRSHIANVRVAVEGAFLHIAPQNGNQSYQGQGQGECEVTIVPASAVKHVRYKTSGVATPWVFRG